MRRLLSLLMLDARRSPCTARVREVHRQKCERGEYEQALPLRIITNPIDFWLGDASKVPALQASTKLTAAILAEGDAIRRGDFTRFGGEPVSEGEMPVWFKGVYAVSADRHWSRLRPEELSDDSKLTTDLSRCQWAPRLALAAAVSEGDARTAYLERLDVLTKHWVRENGYQKGINWYSAQEVSIRSMQLMLTSLLLETHLGLKPGQPLLALLSDSWKRVAYVQPYVPLGEDGLMEQLFLVYGNAFLAANNAGLVSPEPIKKLQADLPKYIKRLTLADGGSAAYSINAHRTLCDALALAKLFDDRFKLNLLSHKLLQSQLAAMGSFLAAIIEPVSGKAPLIGVNDGTLLCLQYADAVQFEPSLLFFAAAFGLTVPAHAERSIDKVWLFGLTPSFDRSAPAKTVDKRFDHFGLLVLDRDAYRAYIAYPRLRYRPVQIDFLHLDLWAAGENLLSDSGTYRADARKEEDGLDEAHAHNMPQLFHCAMLPKRWWYWADTTVSAPAADRYILRVHLPHQSTLIRSLTVEPTRLILSDSVKSDEAWGVVFNGMLEEGKDAMTVRLGKRFTMRFENLQHLSIADSKRADRYHSLVKNMQLTITPADAKKPLTTQIALA